MHSKRLLLLGIPLFLTTGWTPPNHADSSEKSGKHTGTSRQTADTDAVSGKMASLLADSGYQNDFKELFLATSVGGTNGARLNPKALSFIQDYLKENWEELQMVRNTGKARFNIIERVLTQYGLPRELKYLAVIESNLKPTAHSWVGAVGPWQLMPQTARDLGLKVTHGYDERKDYYKSTRAAALYLRDLYNELGDWLLVIAAYNGGTNNVYHAIHKSGSRSFWDLQYYLPAESRIHVKKFIGTQYAFEGQGSVTTLTRQEAMEQLSGSSMYVFHRNLTTDEINNAQTVSVSGKYCAAIIARYTLMEPSDFSRYNPDFDKVMASNNNSYDLMLPTDKMQLFEANKYQILTESVQFLLNTDNTDNRTADR